MIYWVHLQCHRLLNLNFSKVCNHYIYPYLDTHYQLISISYNVSPTLILLCTTVAFADYILMNPSSEYEEIMARVHEKIYLSKVSQTIIQCGWSIREVFPLCVDLVQIDLQLLFRSCYIIFLILR